MLKNHPIVRLAAIISVFFVIAITASTASAQLTGIKNVPGDYATLAAAITDLNTQGVGAGGVTINLVAGNPQTAPAGGYVIGGTGSLVLTTASAANPIEFEGNLNTITASAALTAGALNDAIFKLIGADFVRVNGFIMNENAANTTTTAGTNNMTEWGVALLYVTATDGAQNNTITSNNIALNRTYQNTFGVYANATHTATAVTVSATATGALGGNHNLRIQSNTISNVNNGITVVGPTAAADHNDTVIIANNGLTNYGTTGTFSGYANVSSTVNGILVRNTKNYNVSFNSISSSSGASGVTAGTLRGIFVPAASNQPTGTFTNNINNNSLNISSHVLAGTINGILVETTTSSPTSTTNINQNNFSNLNHTIAAATGTITAISQSGSATAGPLNHSISDNIFNTITSSSTGSFTFISNNWTRPASGVGSVNGNFINNSFNKTGAGGTVTYYTSNSTSPSTVTENNIGNDFSNVTVTGATTIAGWASTDGSGATGPTKTVTNNTFQNVTGGTSAITGLSVASSNAATVSGNIVSNITGTGAITGITTSSGNETFTQNTVHTLSSNSNVSAVTGIAITGGTTKTFSRNKIYNLENTVVGGATIFVNGILVSTAATTTNIFNNLIGDLRAPSAGYLDSIRGISCTTTAPTTAINVSFNTIYINATSVSPGFGTSGLFHTTSGTATTATLNLRDNIVVNTSTATGSGLTVAYRRSSSDLTNYGSVSNNNLFYAGAPSATRLIFNDVTNSDQTLAAFKARVASRDSASVTENPPFLSTSGASANFLHIDTTIATQIESGGLPVAGITDDFDGNTRNVTTPDIGADEFAGTQPDLVAPNINYTNLANTSSNGDRVLSVSVTDLSGVPTAGVGLPVIYYRKNAGAYVSTQCSFVSGSNYNCSIVAAAIGGVTTGDVIGYYVAAQDNANNVSVNPSAGAAGLTPNPPAAATPPTTPNQYTILSAASGTYSVGTGQTYTSLTNAGGIFEFINNSEVTGNITIEITSNLSGELGTNALNEIAGGFSTTMYPCGNPITITGSNAGALIRLNGADNVTIDGNSDLCGPPAAVGGTPAQRHLTIQNTNTGTSAVVISVASNGTNGAQNNKIQNVNVLGFDPTTTLLGISLGGATPGTIATGPNNGNRVENCSVKRAIFGIYSAGRAVPDQNTGTIIASNELSGVTADRIRRVGILVFNENGIQITENSIEAVSTNESADAIGIGVGTQGIDDTNTTAGGVTNATVSRNKINGVASLSAAGFSAAGITVAGGTGGANTIRNNMITGVTAPATSPNIVAGIYVVGATGSNTRLYHNSVAMSGDRGSVATQMPSYGVAITGTDPTIEMKNNIFFTNQFASGGGVDAVSYAIGMVTATFANLDSNYNDFYSTSGTAFRSGSLGAGAGTSYGTLALWQTAVADDANSQEVDPVFSVVAGDLHLIAATTPLLSDGITGFATDDFDGDPRPATAPEIGADELVQSAAGNFPAGTFYNAIAANGDQMSGSVTINGSMTLNGILNTGNFNTLDMGCTATFANAGGGNYVVGTVNKQYCGAGAFTYPVGTTPDGFSPNGISSPEYTPVLVNVTAGTFPSFLSVRAFDAFLTGFDPANSLSRNWDLIELGNLTANLSFTYLNGPPGPNDINGTEANYIVYRRNSNGTTDPMCFAACVDTTNNILGPVTGVTQFSRWSGAALVPTAAGVDVSGRVLTPGGAGLRSAIVTLTDSRGVTRTSRSSSFGYYRFEDVRAGETYVLTVNSKRYLFTPRTVQVFDEVTGLDMTADGEQ